ncbi:UPF0481 protein At3g47200-like [Cucurbita moschata]|uniref:UPF0481 protein At3g47200-like n=1 Tax=Cucurbita moschata TaxID=3662 RepID=A0A6J1EF72_CUCMO|nr:UPF0481 protein At3g47200-like [Cucurbita moschata]
MELSSSRNKDTVVVELSPLQNAVVEITENLKVQLEDLPDYRKRKINGASIYRIPEHIKKVNPNAFKPQHVSFGPYHHGEPHLLPMEKKKRLAVQDFERRCGLSTEDMVTELWDMLEDLQTSYDKLDDKWKTKPAKFLELMMLDGCFMVLVLEEITEMKPFPPRDTLRDMLVLENQLPIKLLDKLYSMLKQENNQLGLFLLNSSPLLIDIVFFKLSFLNFSVRERFSTIKSLVWGTLNFPTPTGVKEMLMEEDYLHVLHMYRKEVMFYNEQNRLRQSHLGMGHEIQLARRFHKAGIKLKKGCNFMDVGFDEKKGGLTLPFIEMNANVESGLLNVMAFEKLSGIANIVGSFVILMGNLPEKDEVDSFNQLAKGTVLELWGRFFNVYDSVNKHSKRPWKIWWTTLKDANFQSPWTIISTFSALIGFSLLIIQTVYGVYGYYLPRRS